MNTAAGVILSAGDKILLLRRAGDSDYQGHWALVGGGIEEGETPQQAVQRECLEEIGHTIDVPIMPFASPVNGYVTHYADIGAEFTPQLNHEHDGFVWASEHTLPEPIHPYLAHTLAQFFEFKNPLPNELDLARAIANGEKTSPQYIDGLWLFDLRITGTGLAKRVLVKRDEAGNPILNDAGEPEFDRFEYVNRPEDYLEESSLDRFNGLPVILEHPDGMVLNPKEFKDRAVGSVMLPYVKGDELWGVSRIYDDSVAQLLRTHQLTTSPGVRLGKHEGDIVDLGDTSVLQESSPRLIDHVAIVSNAVWDKEGEPSGVKATPLNEGKEIDMEDNTPAADSPEMALLKKIAEGVAKVEERSTKLEERIAKLEGGEEGEPKVDASEVVQPAATGANPVPDEEIAHADNAVPSDDLKAKQDELSAKIDELAKVTPAPVSSDEEENAAQLTAKVDSVLLMHGKKADGTYRRVGESVKAHAVRSLRTLADLAGEYQGVDLGKELEGARADSVLFKGVLDGLYEKAKAKASDPSRFRADGVGRIQTRGEGGTVVTRYAGMTHNLIPALNKAKG